MAQIGSLKHLVPPSIVRQKLSVKGCILFTFDDGPDPEITPRVLDVLDEYGARGLFFIPGIRINRAPGLLKEILERKHGIGNHSLTHVANNSLSFKELIHEIDRCRDKIFSLTGITTKIYRPPMGITTPSLILASRYCKHRIMRWSLDVGEYGYMENATPAELAENFLNCVHDRAIVVSHDDKETTPEFLKLVLPKMIDSGFDLKTGLAKSGWR
ncbi:MAG: polysaccharide deacetylase family protein [Candidatus Electrothrix sp. ATG2]|nr:polysaccharide deacetylase family protein [Candidatus Electrothrix sp. ATG2]